MPHEIMEHDSMIYNIENGEPWHGLGVPLDGLASSQEAMAIACPWTVEMRQLYAAPSDVPTGGFLPTASIADVLDEPYLLVPNRFATVRVNPDGSQIPLGTVSDKYRVIQPAECFAFMDVLTMSGDAKYETAGSLRNGASIFLLAKLPNDVRVQNTDDIMKPYCLLTNSFDGSRSLRVLLTAIRVVCRNTENMAIAGASNIFVVRHLNGYEEHVSEARRALGLAYKYFEELGELADALVDVQFGGTQVKELANRLFPDPARESALLQRNALASRVAVENRFAYSETCNLPGIQGTAWAAYQEAVEYADYDMVYSGKGRTNREHRFEALLLEGNSTAQRIKASALAHTLDLAGLVN